jgi:DNA-binding transcriptional LysR family regulator
VPELRQLRTFVAVAEELSFTRAAERLHLGQQAVSKSVAQLERELGVELLERTTREVRLTRAGAALLESGRTALTAADAAFDRAREVGRGLTGEVRVGVSPAIGPAERERVVQVLRDGAPDLAVALIEVRPGEMERRLRSRDLDLILARTSTGLDSIDSASLRPVPAVLCVPAGHPIATMDAVPLARLDGERLLTWSRPGTPFTDLLVDRLAAAGAHVTPVQARVTGDMALTDVAEGAAIALMPPGSHHGDGVVEVALADDVLLPLLVLWPAGVPSPAVERVRAGMSSMI